MRRLIVNAILIGILVVPTVVLADEIRAPVAGVTKELSEALKEAIRNAEDDSENEISNHEKIVVVEDTSMTEIEEPEQVEEPEEHYVIDFTESEFDLMCVVVEAEAGGCSEDCRQLVADVIVNRVSEYGSIEAVLMAQSQFSCVWDGGIERHSVPSKSTVRICKQELKEIGYPSVWYFRDSYYHSYGTPWRSLDNMYFSTK